MIYRKVFVLLICLLLAACHMPQAESNLPQAWIDAPLDGSVLPLAPYEIIFHAFAPGVPAAVELTINGQLVPLPSNGSKDPLTVVRYQWEPKEPGRYILSVRTRDSKGNWSSPHIHVIMIGGLTITPTPVITLTPTPVITVTPTPVITVTPTRVITLTPTLVITKSPTPVPAAGFSNRGLSTNTVSRGRCNPWQVTIQVDAQHSSGIKVVVLFFRLENTQTGELSPWNDGLSMNISNGHYVRTLSGDQLGALTSFTQARVHYQFVLQPKQGGYVRSEVYSDLNLVPCGGGGITPIVPIIPGDIFIIPTLTPEIVK
jgi:hypothetical protein